LLTRTATLAVLVAMSQPFMNKGAAGSFPNTGAHKNRRRAIVEPSG
jgi:hypothetical protein